MLLRSLLAFLCLMLTGCSAQVAGTATAAKAGPINAILIIQKPSRAVGTGSQKDFTDGLVRALQGCQVRVAVSQIDELSLSNGGSDEANALALIQREKPDAVLSFAPTRSVIGQSMSSSRFEARLVEVSSRKLVWRGQAVVKSGIAFGEANGDVGADLVRLMAGSGVLRTCPV